jgi:hypothetical protein
MKGYTAACAFGALFAAAAPAEGQARQRCCRHGARLRDRRHARLGEEAEGRRQDSQLVGAEQREALDAGR